MTVNVQSVVSFLLLAILLQPSYFQVQGRKQDYVVESLSNLFPDANCSSSARRGNGSLPLVSSHGPCSPFENTTSPTMADELRMDKLRFLMMANTLSNTDASEPVDHGRSTLDLPAVFSIPFYLVSIGVGNPKFDQWMFFDTGSYLSWVKCRSCGTSCTRGSEFDPSRSTTYRTVECTDPVCTALPHKLPCNRGGACPFNVVYGKGFSKGVLSRDTLTLINNVFSNFVFGCSYQSDILDRIAGVLGLGNFPYSLPSQLSQIYGPGFSYCLPTSSSRGGHLTFGGYHVGSPLLYTPLLRTTTPYYCLSFTGINVGGQRLPVPVTDFKARYTIIDSGTTFTYLPSSAYEALKSEFQRRMAMLGHRLLAPIPGEDLDTCYDLTGATSIVIPKIELVLDGVAVGLGVFNVLRVYAISKACLAFATQTADLPFIIGYTAHSGLEVVYDLANSRIGFGTGTCS